MPTPGIFDFDETQIADWDPELMERGLREHPVIYLNHLEIACRFDEAAKRARDWDSTLPPGDTQMAVIARHNADLAAYLRKGYYLPGGDHMHRQEP